MNKILKMFSISLLAFLLICPSVLADNDGTASSENKYVFSGSDAVNTGKDNGFSGNDPITKDDPHYGWSMGDFNITGFTSYIIDDDGTVVFLKNAGDEIRLGYEMFQDPEKLNDDEDLELHYDTKAYDEYFQTKTYQHSMGLFVIRKTDYQNKKNDPIIYESFLATKKKNVETKVYLFEEGDYEVALDYEIEEDGSIVGFIDKDSYHDYRLFFKFKVRNGNCMIFPRDLAGNELTNESYAENGFCIDFAKSRYLQIHIKYIVLVEGRDELVEDVRYNRPVADGEKYTQSGIYDISISNQYTKETMTKRIYVGDDQSITMMAIDGMSLEEVNAYLYPPEETTVETEETTTTCEPTTSTSVAPTETTVQPTEQSETRINTETTDEDNSSGGGFVVPGILSVVVVVGGAAVYTFKKKKKSSLAHLDKIDANDNSEEITPVEEENEIDSTDIPKEVTPTEEKDD